MFFSEKQRHTRFIRKHNANFAPSIQSHRPRRPSTGDEGEDAQRNRGALRRQEGRGRGGALEEAAVAAIKGSNNKRDMDTTSNAKCNERIVYAYSKSPYKLFRRYYLALYSIIKSHV